MLNMKVITRSRGRTCCTFKMIPFINLNISTYVQNPFRCYPFMHQPIPCMQKRKENLQLIEAVSSHAIAIPSHFPPRDSVFYEPSCYSVVTESVQLLPTLNQSSGLVLIFRWQVTTSVFHLYLHLPNSLQLFVLPDLSYLQYALKNNGMELRYEGKKVQFEKSLQEPDSSLPQGLRTLMQSERRGR